MTRKKSRIATKVAKEATTSKMLQDNFGEYNLVESKSAGRSINAFQFGRFKKEWSNMTLVTFSGPNAETICSGSKEYLRALGHEVRDYNKNPERGLLLNLSKIMEITPRDYARPAKPDVEKREPALYNLEFVVKGDENLSKALVLVERFHKSRLILGVRNKDNAFTKTEDGNLAVCWNYLNELEVMHTMYESENLFDYAPSIKKAARGEEVILVWDLSKIPLDTDQRKFKVFKKRDVEGVGIDPVNLVDFLCMKFMRLNSNSYKSNSCTKEDPLGCFRVKDVTYRKEVFKWLDLFNITHLSSERDGGRFWIALTKEVISFFRAHAKSDIQPTELIKRIKGGEILPTLTQNVKTMKKVSLSSGNKAGNIPADTLKGIKAKSTKKSKRRPSLSDLGKSMLEMFDTELRHLIGELDGKPIYVADIVQVGEPKGQVMINANFTNTNIESLSLEQASMLDQKLKPKGVTVSKLTSTGKVASGCILFLGDPSKIDLLAPGTEDLPKVAGPLSVSGKVKKVVQPEKSTPNGYASHVRMFMALSKDDQMECLKQSVILADGREEIMKKLKKVFLIDASKGKSLYDVAKTLGALVKPEDIL